MYNIFVIFLLITVLTILLKPTLNFSHIYIFPRRIFYKNFGWLERFQQTRGYNDIEHVSEQLIEPIPAGTAEATLDAHTMLHRRTFFS